MKLLLIVGIIGIFALGAFAILHDILNGPDCECGNDDCGGGCDHMVPHHQHLHWPWWY